MSGSRWCENVVKGSIVPRNGGKSLDTNEKEDGNEIPRKDGKEVYVETNLYLRSLSGWRCAYVDLKREEHEDKRSLRNCGKYQC